MTAVLVPGTHFVLHDELAYYLVERNLTAPDYKGVHRFQIVYVNRDDEIAEYRKDLGLATEFPGVQEFRIPSLWEHTVAELQEIAEHTRTQDDYWRKRAQEIAADSTLIDDWLDQVEERGRVIHNRSTFGPLASAQRNGFDLRAALEGKA